MQLVKFAKEINIGTKEIVDCLNNYGFNTRNIFTEELSNAEMLIVNIKLVDKYFYFDAKDYFYLGSTNKISSFWINQDVLIVKAKNIYVAKRLVQQNYLQDVA